MRDFEKCLGHLMSLLMIFSIFSLLVFSLIGKSGETYNRRSCKTKRLPKTKHRRSCCSSLVTLTIFEQDFGRHVLQRPANQFHFFGKEHLLEDFPEPEVDYFDVQVRRVNNDVLQFDVSVHDVLLFQIVKSFDQLDENFPGNRLLESLRLLSAVREGLTVNLLMNSNRIMCG